ncbi:MAG: hypothetical protein HYV27_12955 [Candidatus Hydrogenedentes bacterium]|nr:hypothetical protein [Candidatus Hydrogenedentota bacterium]
MYDTLTRQGRRSLMNQAEVQQQLEKYAKELNVSLDQLVAATLIAVAEEYKRSTGDGMIPCLS